jgi:hypothetical protein
MVTLFIQLEFLKRIRSTSFARSLAVGIFLGFLALVLLGYLLLLGMALKFLIDEFFAPPSTAEFLNTYLVYYFTFEILYRYFVQQLPVFTLENFLHLPIAKSKIIHYLLLSSFVSPLTLIPFLLFGPFTFVEILPTYGALPAFSWLGSVLLTSWSIHWVMLWFKQRFEDSFAAILALSGIMLAGYGVAYWGWFDIGAFFEPVFTFALEHTAPVILLAIVMVCSYFLCFAFYRQNAYLEDLSAGEPDRNSYASLGWLSRFGLAGEMADLEWKLIVRHKKSRTYLTLCGLFLLYGLIFYINPMYAKEEGFSHLFIFVGMFITGIFMLQYGQLFLSWNSAFFDFFLSQPEGLSSLIKGKYLLFTGISFICFLFSVPYAYFGLNILWIHVATFLFNVGITVHLVVLLALWKPKPMDLNKGAMFNYEGVGIAQFLMIIPMVVAPYLIFLPAAYLGGDYLGLSVMGLFGALGIVAFPALVNIAIRIATRNRHEISSSFRQEI